MNEQLKYNIAITLLEGVGDVLAKRLIAYCGSTEAVFREKRNALIKIPGIGEHYAGAIIRTRTAAVLQRAEEEINFIEKHRICPLFFLDAEYPRRLKNCDDAPVMLYSKGEMEINAPHVLAIVGTRNATEYGKKLCEKIVEELAPYNTLIISGLAYGVDICAHRAAIRNKLQTIGVLGHGLDNLYPSAHRSTAVQMLDNGGLLSNFMSKTRPDKENFPNRNRVIAGLADATVVIESDVKGGAMITAYLAQSYHRDVFAFPGKTTDIWSRGCNRLIKSNVAALIESGEDIALMAGWADEKNRKSTIQPKLFVELNGEENIVVGLLKEHGKLDVDSLAHQAKLPMSKTSSLLLELEFKGVVKTLPGKVYTLN